MRRLRLGEVVRVGDYYMTVSDTLVLIDNQSNWIGTLVKSNTPWRFFRVPEQPKVDPMIAATKRIRAKTTLGQLEKLLAERAKAQRRVTLARDRLDLINRNIAKLAQTMAEQRFDSDLNQATTSTK